MKRILIFTAAILFIGCSKEQSTETKYDTVEIFTEDLSAIKTDGIILRDSAKTKLVINCHYVQVFASGNGYYIKRSGAKVVESRFYGNYKVR